MKTKEELSALKEEVETASQKFRELTDEELEQVVGGTEAEFFIDDKSGDKEHKLYEGTVKKEFEPKF